VTAQKLWRKTVSTNTDRTKVFLSGMFALPTTLMLWENDSNLTIAAWAGGKSGPPTISGGIELGNWSSTPTTGVWQAVAPENSTLPLNCSNIFVGKQRRYRVRTPILQWESPLSWTDSNLSKWGFIYKQGDISPSWDLSAQSLAKWRVVTMHQWSKSYHTVRAVFPENRTILFNQASPYWYGQFVNNTASARRFYIENVPELPLVAGTGFYRIVERSSEVVVEYAPPSPPSPPAALPSHRWRQGSELSDRAIVPVLHRLVAIANTVGLTFEGIQFAHTDVQCPMVMPEPHSVDGNGGLSSMPAAGGVGAGAGAGALTCDEQFEHYHGELLYANGVGGNTGSDTGSDSGSNQLPPSPPSPPTPSSDGLVLSNCTFFGSGGAAVRLKKSPSALIHRCTVSAAGGYTTTGRLQVSYTTG
jgi:hypothetical protein